MSTSSHPAWDQFKSDITTLNGRIEKYQTIEGDYSTAISNYKTAWQKIPSTKGAISPLSPNNPWAALVKIMALLLGAGASVLTNKVGCYASAIKVEEGTNSCNSDLLAITNNTKDLTNAGLIHEAKGANNMIELCSSGSPLSKILGSGGAIGSLRNNFQTMRGWIYTGGTVPGDQSLPTGGVTPQSQGIYFDATATNPSMLTSFAQMHTNAGQQGNIGDASGAASAISTTFGTNSTLLSGVQTSLQTEMTAASNSLQTVLGVANKMGSNLIQLESVATQNQIRG